MRYRFKNNPALYRNNISPVSPSVFDPFYITPDSGSYIPNVSGGELEYNSNNLRLELTANLKPNEYISIACTNYENYGTNLNMVLQADSFVDGVFTFYIYLGVTDIEVYVYNDAGARSLSKFYSYDVTQYDPYRWYDVTAQANWSVLEAPNISWTGSSWSMMIEPDLINTMHYVGQYLGNMDVIRFTLAGETSIGLAKSIYFTPYDDMGGTGFIRLSGSQTSFHIKDIISSGMIFEIFHSPIIERIDFYLPNSFSTQIANVSKIEIGVMPPH